MMVMFRILALRHSLGTVETGGSPDLPLPELRLEIVAFYPGQRRPIAQITRDLHVIGLAQCAVQVEQTLTARELIHVGLQPAGGRSRDEADLVQPDGIQTAVTPVVPGGAPFEHP